MKGPDRFKPQAIVCSWERESGLCGPDGKYYEPREVNKEISLWQEFELVIEYYLKKLRSIKLW